MTKVLKKVFKWLGIAIGAVIVILLLAVGILAMPGPFFPEEKQYRAIIVHSEAAIGKEIDSVMAEVFKRLDAVPVYDPHRKYDLCFCSTQDKFTFFARLTSRANRIMGFSLLGSVFVNCDFLEELAVETGGRPKYSAREGSVVHVATHELVHGYLSDAYGSVASRSLPEWKVEGYCEYGVNQFVAPRDRGYSVPERLDIYLDDSQWNPTASTRRPHYVWGLMIEYLINVKGMSFQQVMADSVTHDIVYEEIMNWRESLRKSRQPASAR
jgi:hypothetical protein